MKNVEVITGEAPHSSKLPFGLGAAIAVALVLTVVSIAIYYVQGFDKLDLSRPGYENEREAITSEPTNKTYDTTSPVSSQALDAFIRDFDTEVKTANAYGDFKEQSLSDAELNIMPDSEEN